MKIASLILLLFVASHVLLAASSSPARQSDAGVAQIPASRTSSQASSPKKHIFFYSTPFPGHLNPLLAQAHGLVEKGYRVTVGSAVNIKAYAEENRHPDVQFVAVGQCELLDQYPNIMQQAADEETFEGSTHIIFDYLYQLHPCIYTPLLNVLKPAIDRRNRGEAPLVNVNVKDNLQYPVDLMVVDATTMAGFDVANTLGIPFIVNNPDLLYLLSPRVVLPLDTLPPMFQELSIHALAPGAGFLQRLIMPPLRALVTLYIKFSQNYHLNELRRIKSNLTESLDSFNFMNGHFIIQNTAFGLEYPIYTPPNVQLVGPCIQASQAHLSAEDEAWLSGTQSPAAAAAAAAIPTAPTAAHVVFVSMGTLAKLNERQLRQLFNGFIEAGLTKGTLRVVWKLNKPAQEKLAAIAMEEGYSITLENGSSASSSSSSSSSSALIKVPTSQLKITNWVSSQTELLEHPNTAIFLSHCGINSAQETVWMSGGRVMLLCIPMFGDQLDMAQRVRDAGIGTYLHKHKFTASQVASSLSLLLRLRDDPAWAKRGENVKRVMHLAGGVDRAVQVIETALLTYPDKSNAPNIRPMDRVVPSMSYIDFNKTTGDAYVVEKSAGPLNEGATGALLLTTQDSFFYWVQWAGIDITLTYALIAYLLFKCAGSCCCCCCRRKGAARKSQQDIAKSHMD